MNIGSVPPGRGLEWIKQGFGLFLKIPLIWIVDLAIFLAIDALLSLIPIIGAMAVMLLQPVFIGGLMRGCEALSKGGDLRIEHLFDGFSRKREALLLVGLYSGIAYLLIGVVAVLTAVGSVGLGVLGEISERPDTAMTGSMLVTISALLLGSALSLPVVMATWFAPALVVFRDASPIDAMKASFFGCLRNVWPFLVYGIAALILSVLAAVPLGLGFLALAPTLVASVYSSYLEIFGD